MENKVSVEVTDPQLLSAAAAHVEAFKSQSDFYSEVGAVTRLFKHTVVPNTWFVLTEEEGWAFVLQGDLTGDAEVLEAADSFMDEDPAFFSALIREDGTWVYSPDPDPNIGEDESPVWHCYQEYDSAAGAYKPSKFAPGTTVYPLVFHANIPGGWTVSSADGTVSEYWQCE